MRLRGLRRFEGERRVLFGLSGQNSLNNVIIIGGFGSALFFEGAFEAAAFAFHILALVTRRIVDLPVRGRMLCPMAL